MPGKQKPRAQKRKEKGLPPFAPGSSPKGGRPPHDPTDANRKIVALMAGIGLPHERIAEKIGVAVETMQLHYERDLANGETEFLTQAGNVVARNLAKGDQRAAEFVLTHKGKKYGWTRGTEITGANGKNLFEGMNLSLLNDAQFMTLTELLKLAGVNIEG